MKPHLLKLFLASCLLFLGLKNTRAAVNVTLGTATTTGLASGSLTTNQTGIGILGFSIKVAGGTSTFSSFQFSATQPISTYFSNFKLYSNTTNSFTSATVVAGTTITFPTSTTLTISGLAQAITNTTKYYFIVANYTVAGSTPVSFVISTTSVTGTTSAAGIISSSTYTLSSATCDWVGNTSSAWTTASNWEEGRVPGSYDIVDIAVNYQPNSSNSIPVVSTAGTTTIAALTFGGDFDSGDVNFPGISVSTGAILNVTGDITFNVDDNPGTYDYNGGSIPTNQFYIKGAGTVQASDLYIYANYGSQAAQTTQQAVISSITNLILTGNLGLTSENYKTGGSTYNQVASFFITGGTTEVDGTINTTNTVSGTTTYPTSTLQINPSSSAGATLDLGGAAALSGLSASGTNIIDVNNTYATVNYTGTNQTVYTSSAANVSGGMSYYDLILSGSGTATPAAGTLAVGYDFTTTATSANFATNNTILTVSDISYIRGGTMTLGSGTFTTSNGLDVYSNSVFNAGTANIADGNFFRVNVDYGNATVNFGSGTTTIGNAVQLFDGTVNCGTGPISVASSTQIYSGATLNAGASPASLTLSGSYQNYSGGTFSAGTGTVYFKSSYDNEGTFTYGAGTIVFKGTTQSLKDGSTGGTIFNNINFNCSGTATITAGTGNFAVASTGLLTMITPAKLVAGTTTTGGAGYLTLMSDANGSASVAAIPSTSSITGNLNIQRYLKGANSSTYRGYRLLASPVNLTSTTGGGNISLAYVNTNAAFGGIPYDGALTGGPSGTANGFSTAGSYGNPTMYLYNESLATNNSSYTSGKTEGIAKVTSTGVSVLSGTTTTAGVTIPVGNGYFLYFIGNNTVSYTNLAPGDTYITVTGYLNQQSVPVTIWLPSSTHLSWASPTGVKGYNLVGNPYASTIDLNKIYTDNGSTGYHNFVELSDVTGNYVYWDAVTGGSDPNYSSRYIASGQGFFVQATSASQTLTFKEDQKYYNPDTLNNVGSQPPGFLSLRGNGKQGTYNAVTPAGSKTESIITPNNGFAGMHIVLQKDSIDNDACAIWFNSEWSDNFDDNDAVDLDGSSPRVFLSSFSADGVRTAINKMSDYTKGKRVKLYVKGTTDGIFNITLHDIHNIDTSLFTVFLIDNYKKDSLDMVLYKTYNFNIVNADTSSFGANRFVIAVEHRPLPAYQLISFTGQKVDNNVQLNWSTANEGTFTGFGLQKKQANGQYAMIDTLQSNGGGNYNYTDMHPAAGSNVYRLEQNDINGNITYSEPITIIFSPGGAGGVFTIYPSPAKELITVNVNSTTSSVPNYVSNIYDTTGALIAHHAVNTNTWTEDVSAYKPGIYIIALTTNDGNLVGKSKFVKTN